MLPNYLQKSNLIHICRHNIVNDYINPLRLDLHNSVNVTKENEKKKSSFPTI